MNTPPSSPVRRFGLKPSRPAPLRLVRGPDAAPCDAQPFPFWLAVVIATVLLAAGAVGARFWLIPALGVAEEEFTLPTVQIRNAERWEEEVEKTVPMMRLDSARPPAPRVSVPIPAVQPEELVRPEIEQPPQEPYDPSEEIEQADEPFPIAKVEPEMREAPPKKSSPKTSRRTESRPKATPKPAAEGKSSPVRVLRHYNPPYPRSARRSGAEGSVMLSVQVRADGRAGSVRVTSSSGSKVLDSAAVSAVKRWSFAPAMKNGRPVSSTVNVPFRFTLR